MIQQDSLYSKYTPIRNKLGKLSYPSVVTWCIEHLHKCYIYPPPEQRAYPAWELLLLLKWALAHGSHPSLAKRNASQNDCARLLNQVKELSDEKNRWLHSGERTSLNKFLRTIAFQQFWTQRRINISAFGRHIKIFSDLPCRYPIAAKFEELAGIGLQDFFDLAFATYSYFNKKESQLYITPNNYKNIASSFAEEVIDRFLAHLSMSFKEARKFALERTKSFSIEEQHLEQTPFTLYPFLRNRNQFFLYSPHLLEEVLRYHVYDLMKDNDGRNFGQAFGETFEDYLRLGLNHTGLPFYSENELRSFYPDQKVVDFLVPLPSCTLLIESKAIEMAPSVRAIPNQAKLAKSLKNSIIKAFKQIYSLAHSIRENDCFPTNLHNRSQFHAFIVTYKELFLIDGLIAWEEFVKDEVTPFLVEEGIDQTIIDPAQIHFLCVEAWDKYIALTRGDIMMAEMLLKDAVLKNWGEDTTQLTISPKANFSFENHLDDYTPQDNQLPYLSAPFNSLIEHLGQRFVGIAEE